MEMKKSRRNKIIVVATVITVRGIILGSFNSFMTEVVII